MWSLALRGIMAARGVTFAYMLRDVIMRSVIKSFADGATEQLFQRRRVAALPPVHPGEVLLEDFLVPMGLSQYALAKAIGVPPQRVLEIVHGRRAVTADTALRLGRYFGVEPQLWLNCRPATTSIERRMRWGTGWSGR